MDAVASQASVKPCYEDVRRLVRSLPRQDLVRLRRELTASASVHLVRPSAIGADPEHGRRLAEEVRREVAQALSGSLDEAMTSLRGRPWS